MRGRDAVHALAGFAAGVAGIAGLTATRGSAEGDNPLNGYWISCRPEGVKTDVICSVAESRAQQSMFSGWYLNAETAYPDWNTALGADCSDRYRDYKSYVKRSYVEGTGMSIGMESNHPESIHSDVRFYFDCYNRARN